MNSNKAAVLMLDLKDAKLGMREQQCALWLIMYIAAKSEDGVLHVTEQKLMDIMEVSGWKALLNLCDKLHEKGLLVFRLVGKKKTKSQPLEVLFDKEDEIAIHLPRFRVWFGPKKAYAEKDPYKRAVTRMMNKIRVVYGKDPQWKPNSERVQEMWEWWLDKYVMVSEMVLGKQVKYSPRNLDRDLEYLAEMATMDQEIVWRAGREVLKGGTLEWEVNGQKWYLAGQKNVYAWLHAAKFLQDHQERLLHMRKIGVMDEVVDLCSRGKMDYDTGYGIMEQARDKGADVGIEMLRANGHDVNAEEAGLGATIAVEEDGRLRVQRTMIFDHSQAHNNSSLRAQEEKWPKRIDRRWQRGGNGNGRQYSWP